MRRVSSLLAMIALALGVAAAPRNLTSRISDSHDFVHFESAHVHPLALTPAGDRLLAINTPDNRLVVFDLTGVAPAKLADLPVGLEPVSVAALSDSECWVVNQLSDDVSIVNLNTGHVRATLRVGDEPSDVVFAAGKAYVSVSQEDAIKVYDAATLAQLGTIAIAGRMPRALARNASGTRVYVAVLNAGNRTSVLAEQEVTFGNPPQSAAPPPNPPMRQGLPQAPITGLIVQKQGSEWVDEAGQVWSTTANPTGQVQIAYDVVDTDVAEIATGSDLITTVHGGIGATNFGLAVSPSPDGRIAVTTTEARNLTRFEPNLSGHIVDTRAALLTPGGGGQVFDLNPGINYSVTPGPASDHAVAMGLPTGVAWAASGQRIFVTALSNDRLAAIDVVGTPSIVQRAPTVAGPTGVVVDDARGRIYVLGRFRGQLQTLSTATLAELARQPLGFDPTPDAIVNGRKFFYGGFTSGHGDQSCGSCHLFGDFDNLVWDLGDPQGDMQPIDRSGQVDNGIDSEAHPMKGPMATQSLRGLPNTGMFHWRADRLNLAAFNPAFVGLMGRAAQLPDSEMAAFTDFVLPLVYPPNPNQLLNRTFRGAPSGQPSAQRGQTFFLNRPTDGGVLTCNACHTATSFGPGTNGQIINNQALQESQDMKIPQLRNLYKKTGFTDAPGAVNKRGSGFIHDGSVDNLFNFLQFPGFNFNLAPQTPDQNRRDVEAFLLAFDTGMAPAVGFRLTFNGANNADPQAILRLDTLETQWQAGYCDLIAKGRVAGQPRGWWYQGLDQWMSDRDGESITTDGLRALGGPGSEVTITGVPPGLGRRMGVERDRDGYLDFDELLAGSDPGNPVSTPANVGIPRGGSALKMLRPNPFRGATEVMFALPQAGRVDCVVLDALGRRVRALAQGLWLGAGEQSLTWNGRRDDGGEAAAGVYFVQLRTQDGSWTRAVVRVK